MPVYRVLEGIHYHNGMAYGAGMAAGDTFCAPAGEAQRADSPGSRRLQPLPDDDPVAQATLAEFQESTDGLLAMSLVELRRVADREQIDVDACRKKAEIAAEIRRVRNLLTAPATTIIETELADGQSDEE